MNLFNVQNTYLLKQHQLKQIQQQKIQYNSKRTREVFEEYRIIWLYNEEIMQGIGTRFDVFG